jgi:glycerate 2-kinase
MMRDKSLHATALAVWTQALRAAAPGPRVAAALDALPSPLAQLPRYVLAVGKAAYSMLDGASASGWIEAVAVGPPLPDGPASLAQRWSSHWPAVKVRTGAHPVPDASSVAAAEWLLDFASAVPAHALLVALISGGASAMVAKPVPGISLAEKVATTSRWMAQGASIAELNAVRRRLSAVKGGQLVAGVAAPVLSLILSDVAGDDPRVVGSGLTVSAAAQPLDALGWLPTDAALVGARAADRWKIIAGQDALARAVVSELRDLGWQVRLLAEPLVASVEQVADQLASAVLDPGADRCSDVAANRGRRHAIVGFGEPSVSVPDHPGRGGRAQHLALLLARRLVGSPVTALIAGSDGVDGPSLPAVAGAIVDGGTWGELVSHGVDPDAAIERCDAGSALASVGALLGTGPTGLNHADVMIVLCR